MDPVHRPIPITAAELEFHIAALAEWSRQSHSPDPIHFQDFIDQKAAFADLWVRDRPQDPLEVFPYPKASGSDRMMGLISPRELALSRAAASAVAALAMQFLSNGTFSARFASPPPNWTFRRNLYFKFMRAALKRISKWECAAMVRTDVRAYFPSIPMEDLLRYLWDIGCDRKRTIFLIQSILTWQDLNQQFHGLPVGPEASSVIGSLYLAPVDEAMQRATTWFYRYMDDMAYGLDSDHLLDLGYDVLDEALERCGVARSSDKSHCADNPLDAADLMRRRDLAYVEAYIQRMPGVRIEPIKEFFNTEVLNSRPVDLQGLHKCLSAFLSAMSAHAVDALLDDSGLFDADPRGCANYLVNFAHMGDVTATASSRAVLRTLPPASRVHLLRVASRGMSNRRLGHELLDLARGAHTTPERIWSLWAYGRSTAYDLADLADAMVSEQNTEVRRAAVLTMQDHPGRGTRYVGRRLSRDSSDLLLSLDWATAA